MPDRQFAPKRYKAAWLLLLAGLLVTGYAGYAVKSDIDEEAQRQFAFDCHEIQIKIEERLQAHKLVLLGGAALFDAADRVERDEWRTYAERVEIDQHFNGIQGLGFSLLIPKDRLTEHIAEIRSQGFPGYTVRPAGGREVYSSIIYLEPFRDRNLRAFGYDMYAEPVRRAAMEQARDENTVSLSGKVELVQETGKDVQAGTLMYAPVYRKQMPLETLAQRRAALRGWVYSPFRMGDLLQGILKGWDNPRMRHLHLQVYDARSSGADSLLYHSAAGQKPSFPASVLFTREQRMDFNGRIWTLHFEQMEGSVSGAAYGQVWMILAGGTGLSILLLLLMLSYLNTRRNAARIAGELTAELRMASGYARSLIEASLDPLVTISAAGKITDVNHATEQVTGRSRSELIGTDFSDYFTEPGKARAGYQQAFLNGSVTDYSLSIRHADGHLTNVLYNASVYRNEAGEVLGVFAAARDVTGRNKAEAALALHIRDLGERIKEIGCLRDITDLLLDREMSVEQVLDACARRIPAGWLEPAHTCARIRLGEKSYESANFHEAEAKLEAVISMPGMEPGLIEVFYFGGGAAGGKSPFLDEEHTLIQSVSIQISQLLEKRQAEMELRQNQAALQDAQRIAHLGSWRLDVASNHVVWSDELYRMFGLNPELPPPDYTEHSKLFTPESWERLSAALPHTRQTGIPYELELETVKTDGSSGWMLARGEVVRDKRDSIVALYGVALDITGRKRAEIALRDTYLERRRFTEVLDNIPSYIYMKDLNRQYIYANKATLKLFGCSAEELVGSGDVKFFPAAAVARLKAVDERVLERGETTVEEIEVSSGNPEWRVYLEVKYPIYDDAGKVSGLCGISTDITEHKRLQAEVARGEALFRNYFELGQIGMAVTSLDQEWLQVNQRLCEILGYTKEELTRMTWTELTHPDDLEPDMVQFRKMLSGEIERYSLDKRFIRKNGEVVYTYLTVSCQRNADRSVEYVIASVEDITWRKQAEVELRKLNNDFVTLLENASDFIYFKDRDSRIRFCSQAMANITGHKSWRDMIGKHDREIFPADTARVYEEEELPVFREGKALLNKTDPYYDEHGKRGWGSTNKWPVFGDDKKTVVGIFGISRDITELKEAENQIKALNRDLEQRVIARTAELEAANHELEAFSYSVSHDLRTPLRAIDGFSRMLVEDYESKLDDEGKRLLNVVRDNTNRMSHLIDDILHFSRAGRTGMSLSEIDMEEVARAVIDELEPLVAGRKLQIKLGKLPNVQGDRAMMHQVFENLLTNAIKFTGKNDEAHIEIGGKIEAGKAVYYVKDDGAGFDMQYADKLFGVFQRLHSVGEFDGTGIGLAIVKRIILRHGGTIRAEGEVGKGATFYFSIPVSSERIA